MDDIRNINDQDFMTEAKADLALLEDIRKEKLKVYNFWKKHGVPVTAILAIITLFLDNLLSNFMPSFYISNEINLFLTLALLGGSWWLITAPKREYAKEYKKKILPRLATLFGDMTYQIDGEIDINKMYLSKIVPSYDKYKSEDYFMGTFQGINLEFSEIKLSEVRGSGKSRRRVTTFEGVAVLLQMQKKKFSGHTIMEKNAGKITEWFKERNSDMKRADLVDPEFEKMFDVYTTDQVEARYLIDMLMIENLKNLNNEFREKKPKRFDEASDKISFFASIIGLDKLKMIQKRASMCGTLKAAFYRDRMLILIPTPYNYFEPADLMIPASNPESILAMKHEIGQILSIIDKLKLYDPSVVHRNAA